MGVFDFFRSKPQQHPKSTREKSSCKTVYADARTIAQDERQYYQPDEYYTMFSYPNTSMERRVITFEERKKISKPSAHGLYVAEILLLEYCSYGNYPKPSSGYPGFWWFEYGIRDVGHVLESLEKRGFICWRPFEKELSTLKVDVLKQLLQAEGLPTAGKKADLINRIISEIPKDHIQGSISLRKYELTELGKAELQQNGYVPYMHKHPHKTTEDARFGVPFNVWSVNRLLSNGDASDWRKIVGQIEETQFGVDMANHMDDVDKESNEDHVSMKNSMRQFLTNQKAYIASCVNSPGDGYQEESKGVDLKRIGKDKEALVQFYIAIGKNFDAPALYREAAKMLDKYELYDEELYVIDRGMHNVSKENRHYGELLNLREQVLAKMKK
jgi:hypothetical protein